MRDPVHLHQGGEALAEPSRPITSLPQPAPEATRERGFFFCCDPLLKNALKGKRGLSVMHPARTPKHPRHARAARWMGAVMGASPHAPVRTQSIATIIKKGRPF